ncbi:MAG: hypothetical protein KAJ19_29360 [Gammaproteobacteria bacterium]|nr:hypothetical protein [Gammaproteobacteria bacterium]
MKEKILAAVVTAMLAIALPQPVEAVSCPMCPPSSQLTPKELDILWDSWVTSLSDSYGRTLDLLDSNKPKESAKEFRNGFVKTIKKLYSEASENYPARFSKGRDWSGWARNLYILTRKCENALRETNTDEARTRLASLREHFYKLHEETDTSKSSDLIYAFRKAARKDKPSIDELKPLRDALEKAKPSMKAKAEQEAFREAGMRWAGRIDSILQDGVIEPSELEPLRTATETFYRSFGLQFE